MVAIKEELLAYCQRSVLTNIRDRERMLTEQLSLPSATLTTDLFACEMLESIHKNSALFKSLDRCMATLERAAQQYRAQAEAGLATEAMQAELHQGLLWFKNNLVGQLYVKLDELALYDSDVDPVTEEHACISPIVTQAASQISTWYNALTNAAGPHFESPFQKEAFQECALQMVRIKAAHRRMAAADINHWQAQLALASLQRFQSLLHDKTRVSDLSSEELKQLSTLYTHFQPYLTTEPDTIDPDSYRPYWKIDEEIVYLLGGKDEDGETFSTSYAVHGQADSLCALGAFKNPGFYENLKESIEVNIEVYGFERADSDKHVEHINARVIGQAYTETYLPTPFMLTPHNVLPAQTLPDTLTSTTELLCCLHDLNVRQSTFKLSSFLLNNIITQLEEHQLLSADALLPPQQQLIQKNLFLIAQLIGEVSLQLAGEQNTIGNHLNAVASFLDEKAPNTTCYSQLTALAPLQQWLTMVQEQHTQAIETTKTKLTSAYNEEMAKQTLQVGLRNHDALSWLPKKQNPIKKTIKTFIADIEQTFDNLRLSKSDEEAAVSRNASYKTIFNDLKDIAQDLINIENCHDRTTYYETLAKIQNYLCSIHDEMSELKKPLADTDASSFSLISHQLEDFHLFLASHYPYPLPFEKKAYPFGDIAHLLPKQTSHKFPIHWYKALSTWTYNLEEEELNFTDLLEQLHLILTNLTPVNVLETAQSYFQLAPKILALVALFEHEHGLTFGTLGKTYINDLLADKFSIYLVDEHQTDAQALLAVLQENNVANAANELFVASLIAPIELRQQRLTSQLTQLQALDTALDAVQNSRVHFTSRGEQAYIDARRKLADTYRPAHALLEEPAFDENFLQRLPDERLTLGRAIRSVTQWLPFLGSQATPPDERSLDLSTLSKTCKAKMKSLTKEQEKLNRSLQDAQQASAFFVSNSETVTKQQQAILDSFIEHQATLCIHSLNIDLKKELKHVPAFEQRTYEHKVVSSLKAAIIPSDIAPSPTQEHPPLLNIVRDAYKNGENYQQIIKEELGKKYKALCAEIPYFKRLKDIQELIKQFKIYLEDPEWCTENEHTKQAKRNLLNELEKIIHASDKDANERFSILQNEIINKGTFDAVMKSGITPTITRTWEFVTYWLMQFMRLLSGRTIMAKDKLVEDFHTAVAEENVGSEASTSTPTSTVSLSPENVESKPGLRLTSSHPSGFFFAAKQDVTAEDETLSIDEDEEPEALGASELSI